MCIVQNYEAVIVCIVMEKSEVLRPHFLSMLRDNGTVIMAETKILPQGQAMENYPSDKAIAEVLYGKNVNLLLLMY